MKNICASWNQRMFIFVGVIIILMMFSAVGYSKTEVYFSANDNPEQVIIKAMDDAKTSIDVCLYSLTNTNIADALIKAYKRGVAVRVILSKKQAGSKGCKGAYLDKGGVLVFYDASHTLQHIKHAIIDDKIVITGSYNWAERSKKATAEILLVISNEPKVAEKYKKMFLVHHLCGVKESLRSITDLD